jgi:protein-disulfide isomerase
MKRALLALLAACASPPVAPVVIRPLPRAPEANPAPPPVPRVASPIPIDDEDAAIGSPDAPVTVVVYLDVVSFYSKYVWPTLVKLRTAYPADQVRLVVRFFPDEREYPTARYAAEGAQGVYALGGIDALWKFLDQVYAESPEHPRNAVELPKILAWAHNAGLTDTTALEHGLADRIWSDTVERHHRSPPVRGTPIGFVNGTEAAGGQNLDAYRGLIDHELVEGEKLVAAGTAPGDVSAIRTRANLEHAANLVSDKPVDIGDVDLAKTRWMVPLAGAPLLGSDSALVTVVMYGDPLGGSCGELHRWIGSLQERYGDDVRFAWRDLTHVNPVWRKDPEHNFLAEIRAERGDPAFWSALAKLCPDEGKRAVDEPFDPVAKEVGADVARTRRATTARTHQPEIEADTNAADDLDAREYTLFVDGRRVQGDISLDLDNPRLVYDEDVLYRVLDEELNRSRAMVRGGVPRRDLYATKMKDAVAPHPEVVAVDPPADTPSTGPASAKLVVQELVQLPCDDICQEDRQYFYKALAPFRSRVRVVVRPRANVLSPQQDEAALEVFAQKGYKAFEQFIVAAGKGEPKRDELEAIARRQGVDMKRFNAALDGHVHAAEAKQAEQLAAHEGTVYVIGGVRAFSPDGSWRYRALLERALAR